MNINTQAAHFYTHKVRGLSKEGRLSATLDLEISSTVFGIRAPVGRDWSRWSQSIIPCCSKKETRGLRGTCGKWRRALASTSTTYFFPFKMSRLPSARCVRYRSRCSFGGMKNPSLFSLKVRLYKLWQRLSTLKSEIDIQECEGIFL